MAAKNKTKKTKRDLFSLVLVTVPSMPVARRLARHCLKARLAACVNCVPRLESHYWWQGKMERSSEVLLIIKTRRNLLPALEQLILENHPYETPEFLAFDISSGNAMYLRWLSQETR